VAYSGVRGIDTVVLAVLDRRIHYNSHEVLPGGFNMRKKGCDCRSDQWSFSLLDRFHPSWGRIQLQRGRGHISHFWPNGKMPVREDWKRLAADNFKDYRLEVTGLVENPVELSLDDLRTLGLEDHITMHHCIQGWSGIAQWGGVSNAQAHRARKAASVRHNVVAFYSFGGSLYGDLYYDTQTIVNVLKPESLLALTMNGSPLPAEYGAPLRLRVENQLGYTNGEVDRTN